MKMNRDPVGQQELYFFGRMSASISHELKNVLAILNENAGLLQDFAAMADQGQPLDPTRIRRLAVTMSEQISRGDVIIKRMNRFAHSADENDVTVDLNELVTMVVELFARTAMNRGVKVYVKPASSTVNVNTDPFTLETLLGNILYRITETDLDLDVCNIKVATRNSMAQIIISGLAKQAELVQPFLQDKNTFALLAVLHAKTVYDDENGEFVIKLPGIIKERT